MDAPARIFVDPLRLEELKATGRLPSPQGVALAVMRLTRSDDMDLGHIASTVRADPALTARIVRAANAPALGMRHVITIHDALLVLGQRTARQLVLGFSLVSHYRDGACEAFDYLAFWRQSILTALVTQAIMARVRGFPPDEAFVAGLLCSVGRLALATLYPDRYSEVLRAYARDPEHALPSLEQQAFATDHLELAGALLQDWGLPDAHAQAVHAQLDPERANFDVHDRALVLARVLHLASPLAACCEGEESGRGAALEAQLASGEVLGLDLEALTELAAEVAAEAPEWCRLLELPELPAGSVIAAPAARAQPEVGAPVAVAPTERTSAGVCVSEAAFEVPDVPLRILLVDSDATRMEELRRQVRADGQGLFMTGDAASGLRLTLHVNPQIVIADWSEPGIDGLALCRALRDTEFGRSIYILLLTSFDAQDRLAEAFEAGADDVVVKPVRTQTLSGRLAAATRAVRQRLALLRDTDEMRRLATDLALNNRRLLRVAMTDSLTGQPNRRYAFERIEQEWALAQRSGCPLACLIADVDHFKYINDACGHDLGDAMLRHVATLLRDGIRTRDVVCRLDGEEFLIICPDTDGEAACALAERLRKRVQSGPLEADGRLVPATISIGVCVMDELTTSASELLKRADHAVKSAKDAGRNCVRLWGAESKRLSLVTGQKRKT